MVNLIFLGIAGLGIFAYLRNRSKRGDIILENKFDAQNEAFTIFENAISSTKQNLEDRVERIKTELDKINNSERRSSSTNRRKRDIFESEISDIGRKLKELDIQEKRLNEANLDRI